MLTRSTYLLLLLLALLLGTASFFMHQSDYPLTYDEGDYWTAIQSGMWTNWTDADDISFFTFVRKGVAAVQDAESRAELSDWIRNSGSTMFYRHYHPPLAFYPAIALQPLTRGMPLRWQLRLANLFWLLVWIAALAWIGWRRADARTPAVLLLPASAAWAMAVVGYNMHLPFGLLVSLFFLCWYLAESRGSRDGRRKTGDERRETKDEKRSSILSRLSSLDPSIDPVMKRAAQFFFAAALATVEYGMFVLFFIVVWGVIAWWRSDDRRGFLRGALASAGWVLLFLAVLWPAGVINLNLVKSWTFVMYVALFRLAGEPVAFAGWWNLIIDKWNANPAELLILLVLLGGTIWRWRDLLRRGSLFAASGFIAALLYLQINPTLVYRWYLFPAFAVGFLFLGHVWMGMSRGERREGRGRETGDERRETGDERRETGDERREARDERRETGGERQEARDGRRETNDLSPVPSQLSRLGASYRGGAWTVSIVGMAVAMFIAAWWLVPEPDYTELKELHAVVDRAWSVQTGRTDAETGHADAAANHAGIAGASTGVRHGAFHLTVPRSVLPQLRPYYPDAQFVSYHDVEYAEMVLADSLPSWRERGLVIVPAGVDVGEMTPDGVFGEYEWFGRR